MLTLTWDAIRPTPVEKGSLIEPEATDRHAPRPWWYLPPGSSLLIAATAIVLTLAAVHSGFQTVREEGLPVQVPVLSQRLAPKTQPAHHLHHKSKGKLHSALQADRATSWSTAE